MSTAHNLIRSGMDFYRVKRGKGDAATISVYSLEARRLHHTNHRVKSGDLLWRFPGKQQDRGLDAFRADGFKLIVERYSDDPELAFKRLCQFYDDAVRLHDAIVRNPPTIKRG